MKKSWNCVFEFLLEPCNTHKWLKTRKNILRSEKVKYITNMVAMSMIGKNSSKIFFLCKWQLTLVLIHNMDVCPTKFVQMVILS